MIFKKKYLNLNLGLFFIILVVLMAVIGPLLTSYDPTAMSLAQQYLGPSADHIFGQDENGVDLFAQVMYGARTTLYVAFLVTFFSLIIGLFFGSISGFLGGMADNIIMRFIDLAFALPSLILVIVFVGFLQEKSTDAIILIMTLTGWAGYARLVRGEVLHLKENDFVASSVSIGASRLRQLVKHIWPNLWAPLIIQASFGMAVVIITEASLSFLGLGASEKIPTWGALLRQGKNNLMEAPHICFFPGMAILILVLGFNLFGDGLRDYLDPKTK